MQFLIKHKPQSSSGAGEAENDIEQSLIDFGHPIGERVLELTSYRSKDNKRMTNIVDVLHFITSQVWKLLFNKSAAGLEQSSEDEDEYWIRDDDPCNKFISSKDKVN